MATKRKKWSLIFARRSSARTSTRSWPTSLTTPFITTCRWSRPRVRTRFARLSIRICRARTVSSSKSCTPRATEISCSTSASTCSTSARSASSSRSRGCSKCAAEKSRSGATTSICRATRSRWPQRVWRELVTAQVTHAIIGTAGHIDHGKTALIKALTGHDTDRLKEEKERGISDRSRVRVFHAARRDPRRDRRCPGP